MGTVEYVKAWKFIKESVKQVKDPVLKNVMMAEFRKRAVRDWGFDPETSRLGDEVVLDDWEKELVEDINDFRSFGVDTRVEKREKERQETKARMKDFILKGGCLKDIPEDIRSGGIEKLYYECLFEYGDEIMAEIG